jgi:ribonuclease HII
MFATATALFEDRLRDAGFGRVAGVDEAGRGALAGPLVAAAVILPRDCPIQGLADSKLLTPQRRRFLAAQIQEHAVAVAVARIGPDEHWAALRRLGPSAYHRHSFTGVAAPWATGHPAVTNDQEQEGDC